MTLLTHETIDKCLDFAEGSKGKFTISMAKKPEFPENLILGTTERQRTIKSYREQGYNTRKIAAELGCSQPNIVEHLRQYEKACTFYEEWCEFWEQAELVRGLPFQDTFKELLPEEDLIKYQKRNVGTIGDYLRLSVVKSSSEMLRYFNDDAENKAVIFEEIRKICHQNITVMTGDME